MTLLPTQCLLTQVVPYFCTDQHNLISLLTLKTKQGKYFAFYLLYMSRLRACGPVIPGILSLQPELVRPWYVVGCHSTRSVMVMNTISLLLLGRHALTSPEGGGRCSLGTFDYGVVGHLAFRLT